MYGADNSSIGTKTFINKLINSIDKSSNNWVQINSKIKIIKLWITTAIINAMKSGKYLRYLSVLNYNNPDLAKDYTERNSIGNINLIAIKISPVPRKCELNYKKIQMTLNQKTKVFNQLKMI